MCNGSCCCGAFIGTCWSVIRLRTRLRIQNGSSHGVPSVWRACKFLWMNFDVKVQRSRRNLTVRVRLVQDTWPHGRTVVSMAVSGFEFVARRVEEGPDRTGPQCNGDRFCHSRGLLIRTCRPKIAVFGIYLGVDKVSAPSSVVAEEETSV